MADNFEISNTLESLQKAVEIIDHNMQEMKVKLQAPHLYLDPFKIEISNNAWDKVHKMVVTCRDSVLTLLKEVKEQTEDWQKLNDNIIMSNLAIRNELKQFEINLEQYGYTPLSDLKILEVSNICKSGIDQDLSPVTSNVKQSELYLENDDIWNDTLVTPMLCRKSKSQRSIEKDLAANLLETINIYSPEIGDPQSEEGYSVQENEIVEESVPNVIKNCDLDANPDQKEKVEETQEEGTNKEIGSAEASTTGCGKYSVYYYKLLKARRDRETSNIVEEGEENKNKTSGNAAPESGKYSVYYYELMKKSGKKQAQ